MTTSTIPLTGVSPQASTRALNQERTPLVSAVASEMRSTRWRAHVPGHAGGRSAESSFRDLVGERALQADLWMRPAAFAAARREAEDLAAEAWGAERAWLLEGGSTAGNQAWCATLRDGQEVVIARDVDVSLVSGLSLSGVRPRWVAPRRHERLGIPAGVHAADLDRVLSAYPHAKHVLLTSPNHAGVCTDLTAAARVASAHGAQLYVDSAWGAHLRFHPSLPQDAMTAGASAAVISADMTGSALSSGAVLLAGPGADLDRLDAAVRERRTTRPFLPLLASIDSARHQFATAPGELAGVIDVAGWLRRQLRRIPGITVIGAKQLDLVPGLVDPTKLVVDVSRLRLSGWEADSLLRADGITVLGADATCVYLMLGATEHAAVATAGAVLAAMLVLSDRLLFRGLSPTRAGMPSLESTLAVSGSVWDLTTQLPEAPLTPRQAQQAAWKSVSLAHAAGLIAAEAIVPYPPGIPVVVPGEVISSATVRVLQDVLKNGGHLDGDNSRDFSGVGDGGGQSAPTVRVVATRPGPGAWPLPLPPLPPLGPIPPLPPPTPRPDRLAPQTGTRPGTRGPQPLRLGRH
jgi:arginine decarboxylase